MILKFHPIDVELSDKIHCHPARIILSGQASLPLALSLCPTVSCLK